MFSKELAKLILTKLSALSPKLEPGTRATPFSSRAIRENSLPFNPDFEIFGKA